MILIVFVLLDLMRFMYFISVLDGGEGISSNHCFFLFNVIVLSMLSLLE